MSGAHTGRRTTITISPGLLAAVKAAAASQGVAPGEVVRQALEGFLASGEPVGSARTLQLTVSLPEDLAEDLAARCAETGARRPDVVEAAILWALGPPRSGNRIVKVPLLVKSISN